MHNYKCLYCYGDKACRYCYGLNRDSLITALSPRSKRQFIANMKALWAIDGERIDSLAQQYINQTQKLTIANVLAIIDSLGYPRIKGTMVVFSYLEWRDILPTGTYERLKRRGFKPTQR